MADESITGINEVLREADEAPVVSLDGDGLVRLALDILAQRPVPPALFIRHHLVTPENVDHFYPNDVLLVFEPSRF